MAHCRDCNQDMLYATDCSFNRAIIYPDGVTLPSIPFIDNYGDGCWDCGIADGNHHHPDCEAERCPRHGDQLISCGCGGKATEAPVSHPEAVRAVEDMLGLEVS